MREIDLQAMDLRALAKVLEGEKGMPVSAQAVRDAADRIEATNLSKLTNEELVEAIRAAAKELSSRASEG